MSTRLSIASHPAAVWAEVAGPWLRAHGANWREKRVVLAPNAAWIAALKGCAVAEKLPVLGLEWHTPGRWRSQALAALPGSARRIALREDLHLLLELAANSLPENPLARAYGADPAPFQELLDTLEGAGWDAQVLPDADARELALVAEKLRAQAGWITSAAADHLLRTEATTGKLKRLGQKLLVVGFGSSDWSLAAFLESAITLYEDVEVVFDVAESAVEREQSTATWIGSWEEKLNVSAAYLEAPLDAPAPFAHLAFEFNERSQAAAGVKAKSVRMETPPVLWLAENLQAEADLVTAQALAFLSESENSQVGVVVGAAGSALAREVAARFTALGLSHHDATGHLPGREKAQMLFEAWLDWQEAGRLAGLVTWARAAERWGLLTEKNAKQMEKYLKEAVRALLTDDPGVIAAWLGENRVEAVEACAFLANWPRLPELASANEFLTAILAVSAKLQWPASPEVLAQRVADWGGKLIGLVPRAAILRWVRAVTRVPGRTRDALGREPWARLQIIDAASAAAQSWTHLVLGGLLHGEWPEEDRDSPLFDDTQINLLNRQTVRQGSQGEGHWTVTRGRGLLLTSAEYRRMDRANFSHLVALPMQGLALSARLADPATGRRARLSEYFWTVARSVLGRLPTEDDWTTLASLSKKQRDNFANEYKKRLPGTLAEITRNTPGPELAARAYNLRRNDKTPFDEFSFCLRAPPIKPLRLSCKAWEEALQRPGASWFKHLLKAEPRWNPAEDDPARMSMGMWAHDWVRPQLANAAESAPLPNGETWRNSARRAASRARASAEAAFAAAGRPLPESWFELSVTAGRLAEQWIFALAGPTQWTQALAEINLPKDLLCALPGIAETIPLTGRMDLVLFPAAVVFASKKLNGTKAWVLDYKTGVDKPLSVKRLEKGVGLQLALYAQALLALGAGEVSLTLLNADANAVPQLTNADLASPELTVRWQLLANFAVHGIWGERLDLEDEHAEAGAYPSATLPIPVEILRQKWELTHPPRA